MAGVLGDFLVRHDGSGWALIEGRGVAWVHPDQMPDVVREFVDTHPPHSDDGPWRLNRQVSRISGVVCFSVIADDYEERKIASEIKREADRVAEQERVARRHADEERRKAAAIRRGTPDAFQRARIEIHSTRRAGWWEPNPYKVLPPTFPDPQGEFAYGVWTAIAVTLAEPIRKALFDHGEAHGCISREHGWNFKVDCEERRRIDELLPLGESYEPVAIG